MLVVRDGCIASKVSSATISVLENNMDPMVLDQVIEVLPKKYAKPFTSILKRFERQRHLRFDTNQAGVVKNFGQYVPVGLSIKR